MIAQYINTFGSENVYIVTNGCTHLIMTSLRALIRREKILCDSNHWECFKALLTSNLSGRMISAQGLHGNTHRGKPTMWKVLVFRQIVAEHFGLDEVVKECSIISIG